jgi:hypothetical protein
MIKRSDEIQILLFIVQKGHENNYISSGVQKDKFGGQGLEPSNGTHNQELKKKQNFC